LKMIINNLHVRGASAAIISAAMALAVMFGIPGCGRKEPREGSGGDTLKVAADIMPMADFCRHVGGDLVEVEILIPAGASPHTYELTSEQMKFLSEADLLVTNGLGLIPWAEDLYRKVDNPGLVAMAAAEAVPRSELIEVDGGGENGVYDPHVWLDPNLAVYQVEAIRDALVEADPENGEEYRENAKKFIEELKELDGYIREKVAAFTETKFVSFHPAWGYFARRYGLEQVGVVEELPGKEPSAGEIAELVDLIKEEGVRVVFTEPQFNPKAAEAITGETGAEVVLKDLDPLGDPDDSERDGYIKLIRYDLGVMEGVMR